MLFKSLFILLLILCWNKSNAWVYPEHREIALIAISELPTEYRVVLDKLWSAARTGYESRLTASVIDTAQSTKPTQLDYAAWFAIGGDHSCSPEELLNIVLKSDWILKVADIAAQLKIDIRNSKNNVQHINAIRESDIRLQRADEEYATRAGANNVHFLLARPGVNTTAIEYAQACLSSGAPLNALGAYSWFHISAMNKAARCANASLSPEQKSALILSALADEAFGLHFLEDAFAAGHIAGTWGNASLRKGTHDYYNEKGLEVVTWEGKRMIVLGDAYMRLEDAENAASAVKISLEQLLNAASGKTILDYSKDSVSLTDQPDSFSVCRNNFLPGRDVKVNFLKEVLITTPVPGLATGAGEHPRFRAELGTFFGISTSLNVAEIAGGFGEQQNQNGAVGGIETNFRWGFGLDGVLNQAGDGLVYIQAGWRLDGSSTNPFSDPYPLTNPNISFSAIPGRSAYNLRMRLPFWLIPGDLILAAPILLFLSPGTFTKMAVIAANGGLIPWQSGITTSIGRFQFVLGREIGVSLYGLSKDKNQIFIPVSSAHGTLLRYKSTQLDFPILEYRPFRTFSLDQSSSLEFQIYTGVDIPYGAETVQNTGDPIPPLKKVWQIGLRIMFDWRRYY